MTPWTDRQTDKKLQNVKLRQTAIDITAEDLIPRLNQNNVADLVLISMVRWAETWQHQQSQYALSEDSDQPGHPPSLIRVFAVRMKKAWVLSYLLSAQQRLWSDWADAQADLTLCLAHSHFVSFVMSRLRSLEEYCLAFLKKPSDV